MPKSTLTAIALAAALLVAPAMAETTSRASTTTPAGASVATPAAWWHSLGDVTLHGLIQQGLDANLDVEGAHARIRQSRALLAGAEAARGPSGSAGLHQASSQASRTDLPGLDSGSRRTQRWQAGVEFSWEADLFGRLESHMMAARQRLVATEAQAEGVRLAVSAEIAHVYFAWLGAREQLELAREVAAGRERVLALVRTRARSGYSAPIDEIRVQAELEAALAEIPVQEAAVRVALHRLAVLTGQPPAGFALAAPEVAPAASLTIQLPIAPDWLANRPDVQEHEAALRAHVLDVQAIRAEFMPRLTFSGMLGFVAGSAARIGSGGTLSWISAPSLLAPLLDRGRIEARLQAAKAQQKGALAAYRQRLLLAAEEVENALTRYATGVEQFNALQRRANLSVRAENLARTRYEAGAADLLELLDAQRSAQRAQSELAAALTAQRQHLVALFKGTGGAVHAGG